MRRISKINTYSDSFGNRWTSQQLDSKIRKACRERMEELRLELGVLRCWDCGINERHAVITPSHDISVKYCKENGCVELAYCQNNITPRCLECHRKYDKLNVQWKKK